MPRKQKKYHYIYKTTCVVTNRYYYGMHSTSNLEDGYIGSGTRLWHSINYHGRENHSIEILEYFDNRMLLKSREKELITEELLNDPMCMNIAPGGGGGFSNKEHQLKCSTAGNESIANKLKTDPAFKQKLSTNATKTITENHKNGVYKYGHQFKDKKHSEETKKKMSESSNNKGSNNSQFGTCWIHKNGMTTKIKKENLDSALREGWIKGRK